MGQTQSIEIGAYSIATFCVAHSISRSTFYALVRRNEAPRIFRVGSKIRISREAAYDWRNQSVNSASGAVLA